MIWLISTRYIEGKKKETKQQREANTKCHDGTVSNTRFKGFNQVDQNVMTNTSQPLINTNIGIQLRKIVKQIHRPIGSSSDPSLSKTVCNKSCYEKI